MSELGISTSVHQRAFTASNAPPPEILDLDMSGYSHTIIANGGYDTAQIVVSNPSAYIPRATSLLGRHIEANAGTARAWEGFINTIEISIGDFSMTIGPFTDIANEITVVYQEPSYSVPVPTGGEQIILTPVSDLTSQEEYGVHSILYNLSESALESEATQIANMLLGERKNPRIEYSVSSGASKSGNISMRLSCLGYYHAIKMWPYTSVSITGTTTIGGKVGDILDTDPNGLFDETYALRLVEPNATVVWNFEDGTRTAFDALAELVKFGDSSLARWIWGVYKDRQLEFLPADTDTAYAISVLSNPIGVARMNGDPASMPLARPGRYAVIVDMNILVGATNESYHPLSKVFIESVEFTAPDKLKVGTSDVSKVSRMLGYTAGLNGLI